MGSIIETAIGIPAGIILTLVGTAALSVRDTQQFQEEMSGKQQLTLPAEILDDILYDGGLFNRDELYLSVETAEGDREVVGFSSGHGFKSGWELRQLESLLQRGDLVELTVIYDDQTGSYIGVDASLVE